ncbi:6-pyruvoyl trahydropterin synthase family protein [Sansalvadorimonas verongulae]|uniref:6-pyruvoyl trahydropterin synthase family protein n=1 Tax=Sansalvadorimonas verongulae TaxID=2172824 RepID=UPI0012BB9E82|nr:6-carboxytetrahydropterin synthase [Sansalvadorimonas verongulae]MTI15452.1 6-pyruvoyl tetrahydropterin reductase [Sansalvadorimonas verongulae]
MSALFVEQLTTIDFSYLCPERGLTGETWLVDVVLTGELNDEGMVFDFGHVKKEIKTMIDSYADHALLVPLDHPAVTIKDEKEYRTAELSLKSGGFITCQAPLPAILPLPVDGITPEAIRPLLEKHILKGLPDNVQSVEMHLYPEDIQGAYFHYSHGLKKHQGDCQRIAHGHRSQIKIYSHDKRSTELESQVSGQWQDIYLATREDIIGSEEINGIKHLSFGYQAIQGRFELQIPAKRCYLMDTDTTIELIAAHLAQSIADDQQSGSVKVIVNEGFHKGAIGIASA